MNEDLKIIKKKYGEQMMHYCRRKFPTILEYEGLLSKLLLDHFNECHNLYSDIQLEKKFDQFEKYIYSLIENENNEEIIADKTPKELLAKAGYDLYECKTQKDIQYFKKYYDCANGEELCTFADNRLFYCYVFFAVKKDVDKIKRKDFPNPERQDLYGTSVISIQFTRREPNILSIKNRYNHKVDNPDATFSNNLDNIIGGLTRSFEKEYGFIQTKRGIDFELNNYVSVKGKYYKYNYEINNVYYCPDNIIIDNYEVIKYDKSRYIIIDYFILDLKEKKIISKVDDSFKDTICDIDKITIVNNDKGKEIYIVPTSGSKIVIEIDKKNRIIKYINNNIKYIGNKFLYYNKELKNISLLNLESCGDLFLKENNGLRILYFPKLIECGKWFLARSKRIKIIVLPSLKQCDDYFLQDNNDLEEFIAPELTICGHLVLQNNKNLKNINLQNLKQCGDGFLANNELIESLSLPCLTTCGSFFLYSDKVLKKFNLPKLREYKYDINPTIYNILQKYNKIFKILREINNPDINKSKSKVKKIS